MADGRNLEKVKELAAYRVSEEMYVEEMDSRAMVLDAGRRITVQMPKGSRKHLYLSVDGGKVLRVTANERVQITQSQYSTRLVQLAGRSFYQVINQKLGGYAP